MIHALYLGKGRERFQDQFNVQLTSHEGCIERGTDRVMIRYVEGDVYFYGDPPGNKLEQDVERAVLNLGCWARGIGAPLPLDERKQ